MVERQKQREEIRLRGDAPRDLAQTMMEQVFALTSTSLRASNTPAALRGMLPDECDKPALEDKPNRNRGCRIQEHIRTVHVLWSQAPQHAHR